ECKADGVQIDRFETLYPQIVTKIKVADMLAADQDTTVDPARWLLERWTREQAKHARIPEEALTRPFDADARLYAHLEQRLIRSSLPPDFIKASVAFARAYLDRNAEIMTAVCGWISGVKESISLPSRYLRPPSGLVRDGKPVNLRAIGKGTAR